MLKNDRIAIRDDLSMNEIIFELAYELSHAIIHNNCGNMPESEKWREYHLKNQRNFFYLEARSRPGGLKIQQICFLSGNFVTAR